VNITDITFTNFTGSSSGKNGVDVASLVCSPNAVCEDITLSDINITSPAGDAEIICDGISGDLGVPCVSD
jgi:galacturan 1,4-alpha-galacturonidase